MWLRENWYIWCIKRKNSVFDLVKDTIKGHHYFKLIILLFFLGWKNTDNFIETLWNIGMKIFEEFMYKFNAFPQKILTQSRKVLNQIKQISL